MPKSFLFLLIALSLSALAAMRVLSNHAKRIKTLEDTTIRYTTNPPQPSYLTNMTSFKNAL